MSIPSWLETIFIPLGLLYGNLMRWRRWLYSKNLRPSYQLPGLVISVGNLEVGGTGKSPVVIALAAELILQGARPVILTRGYRSGLKPHESAVLLGSGLLLAPPSGHTFQADEARMQAETLQSVPVIIGEKRKAAALRYLEKHPSPTHWILDDGFQHLKLRRHLDIVLLNATDPLAQGRCLPAGRLREWPGTLRVAQHIILTRAVNSIIPPSLLAVFGQNVPFIHQIYFSNGKPQQMQGELTSWQKHKSWLLALGVAFPQRIVKHCQEQGLPILQQLIVSDHQVIPHQELQQLSKKVEGCLTTAKDYWRQPEVFAQLPVPVYILPLCLEFFNPKSLSQILAQGTD